MTDTIQNSEGVEAVYDIKRNPKSIWLSPICDDTAHHGDGRAWAAPAPAETCGDCLEPWVRYVREDLASLAREPATADVEREERTALLPDNDHAGILIRAAEDAEVAAALHRTAIADGLTDDAGAAEWAEKQARTFRVAAAALSRAAPSSEPAIAEGEREPWPTRMKEAIESAVAMLREPGNWIQGPDFCGDIVVDSRLLIATQLEEAIDGTYDDVDEEIRYDREGPQ